MPKRHSASLKPVVDSAVWTYSLAYPAGDLLEEADIAGGSAAARVARRVVAIIVIDMGGIVDIVRGTKKLAWLSGNSRRLKRLMFLLEVKAPDNRARRAHEEAAISACKARGTLV